MKLCKGPIAPWLEVRCAAQEDAARAEGQKVAAEQEHRQISPAAQHNPADSGAPLQGMDLKPPWVKSRDFAAGKRPVKEQGEKDIVNDRKFNRACGD